MTGQLRAVLTGHKGPVVAVTVAPDGACPTWLATADLDGAVRMWVSVTGETSRSCGLIPRTCAGPTKPTSLGPTCGVCEEVPVPPGSALGTWKGRLAREVPRCSGSGGVGPEEVGTGVVGPTRLRSVGPRTVGGNMRVDGNLTYGRWSSRGLSLAAAASRRYLSGFKPNRLAFPRIPAVRGIPQC
jgi:hypothetical protein